MPDPPVHRRSPRKSMGPDLAPLYLSIVLVGGGIAAAGWLFSRKQEIRATDARAAEEAAQQEVDPFAHIPDEVLPRLRRAGDELLDPFRTEPTGLEAEPAWIEARALADEAWAHAAEARAAEAAEKPRTFAEETEAARAAFLLALERTAEWELVLVEKHGERDPIVRRIVRTRRAWAEALRELESKDR